MPPRPCPIFNLTRNKRTAELGAMATVAASLPSHRFPRPKSQAKQQPRAALEPIPPRRLFAFIAMCFGMFMAFLDIQIVSASLSEIQAGLSASADEIPWVQTAYLIA